MWHWWFVLCIMQGLHEYAIEIATANDLMYRKNLFHLIISGCWFGTSVILHNIRHKYFSRWLLHHQPDINRWRWCRTATLYIHGCCTAPSCYGLRTGRILPVYPLVPFFWLDLSWLYNYPKFRWSNCSLKHSKTIYSTLGLVQSPLYSSVNKHNHGKLPICRWFI